MPHDSGSARFGEAGNDLGDPFEALSRLDDGAEQLPWAGAGLAIEHLRSDLEAGFDWYPAVLRAIARWDLPSDVHQGRRYEYLIDGEAFDWLLLVERFYAELGALFPNDEIERLLFAGEPPGGFSEVDFQAVVGPTKFRSYLNYYYGVTVEEALNRAVEEQIMKERAAGALQNDRRVYEDLSERIYGLSQTDLLARFRSEVGLGDVDAISYHDWKRFTYWRFKYRLRQNHRVKVAADTKRGIDMLERLRIHSVQPRQDEAVSERQAIELEPWLFRLVE